MTPVHRIVAVIKWAQIHINHLEHYQIPGKPSLKVIYCYFNIVLTQQMCHCLPSLAFFFFFFSFAKILQTQGGRNNWEQELEWKGGRWQSNFYSPFTPKGTSPPLKYFFRRNGLKSGYTKYLRIYFYYHSSVGISTHAIERTDGGKPVLTNCSF